MSQDNTKRKTSKNKVTTPPTISNSRKNKCWDVVSVSIGQGKEEGKKTIMFLRHFDNKFDALKFCGELNKNLRFILKDWTGESKSSKSYYTKVYECDKKHFNNTGNRRWLIG